MTPLPLLKYLIRLAGNASAASTYKAALLQSALLLQSMALIGSATRPCYSASATEHGSNLNTKAPMLQRHCYSAIATELWSAGKNKYLHFMRTFHYLRDRL